MKNYSDTIFNEFSVKFGLTPDEIAQDQLQFYIAFELMDVGYDVELEQSTFSDEDQDKYVSFAMEIWSEKNEEFIKEDVLSLHRCNETDKNYFS